MGSRAGPGHGGSPGTATAAVVGEGGRPYIARAGSRSPTSSRRTWMDWFYLYFIGFLILIAAVGMALNMIGLSASWIFVVCLALFGVAVMSAVKRTRRSAPDDDTG